MNSLKRLLLVLAVAVSSFGFVGSANAQEELEEGPPDNVAVAVNTKDGSELFRFAFSIDRIMRESSDPDNAAVAYSSCENCRTTAIAIQVVLLMTPPEDVTPTNLAIAVNEQCQTCQTVALAYQIVMQVDGPVRLTDEGLRRIAEINRQIRDLEDLDLSPAELDARVDGLVDELQTVLNEELQPVGSRRSDGADADQGVEAGEPTPTGSPLMSPDTGTEPEPTTQPTEDPTASAAPTTAP